MEHYGRAIMALTKRDLNLRTRYGMTERQFEELLSEQSGMCAICGAVSACANAPGKVLYVDHDHETGEIRGLLCRNCNSGLGMFQDKPELIAKAFLYLKIANG